MPLDKHKSKKAFSKNVKELMGTFRQKGKIGSSHPQSTKAALKQSLAIAYRIKEGKK